MWLCTYLTAKSCEGPSRSPRPAAKVTTPHAPACWHKLQHNECGLCRTDTCDATGSQPNQCRWLLPVAITPLSGTVSGCSLCWARSISQLLRSIGQLPREGRAPSRSPATRDPLLGQLPQRKARSQSQFHGRAAAVTGRRAPYHAFARRLHCDVARSGAPLVGVLLHPGCCRAARSGHSTAHSPSEVLSPGSAAQARRIGRTRSRSKSARMLSGQWNSNPPAASVAGASCISSRQTVHRDMA